MRGAFAHSDSMAASHVAIASRSDAPVDSTVNRAPDGIDLMHAALVRIFSQLSQRPRHCADGRRIMPHVAQTMTKPVTYSSVSTWHAWIHLSW